ncbi:MAG: energy transducer TonB [Bacteroidetes bacterium]|nr:energy transducer TonB [Bacteroidota bacterium]
MHHTSENETQLKVVIPWDKFTARGFFIASSLVLLLLLLSTFIDLKVDPYQRAEEQVTPITILSFGKGNGKGISKGNLTREGAKSVGKATKNPLEDAQHSSSTKSPKIASTDITQSNNIKPVKDISSQTPSKNQNDANSTKDIGTKDGSHNGDGLGDKGTGRGKGEGLGDIDWGGGGNRTVLYKQIPPFPPGATSSQIRIRFTVHADGTVGTMIPLQKGDPLLERAAMEALRRWKFNPIAGNMEMTGIIPFTFRLE